MTAGSSSSSEPPAGPPATRRLLVLRHAAAEPGGSLGDERRPLTLTGRRQSAAVGTWLAAAGLSPDHVLVSPAVRARQTWDVARGALGAAPTVDVVDELYSAGPRRALELLLRLEERVATVLVVGHEPTVSALAALLAAPDSATAPLAQVRTGLATAACAVLAPGSWHDLSAGTVPLLDVVHPAG